MEVRRDVPQDPAWPKFRCHCALLRVHLEGGLARYADLVCFCASAVARVARQSFSGKTQNNTQRENGQRHHIRSDFDYSDVANTALTISQVGTGRRYLKKRQVLST
jgi:hypothetical protein